MSTLRTNLPAVVTNEVTLPPFPESFDEHSNSGMSMAQIMSILRANLRRSLIALLALVFVTGIFVKALPKSYVATATLIVNHGDKDPLASTDFTPAWNDTFIPTQIELIRSPAVLQPVIDRLHLIDNRDWTGGFSGPPAALREAIFTRLQDSVNVYRGSGSELLYISASAKYPDEAATIANAVATEYLRLNRKRIDEPARRRARLYSQQLKELREKTIQAQDQVTAFRQRHGMINVTAGGSDEAVAALNDLERKLLSAENRERNLQAQLQARAWGSSSPESDGTGDLARKLSADEAQLARMRQALGPRHPGVLELQSQIASIKHSIAAGVSRELADAKRLVDQYSAAVDHQRNLVLKRRRTQDQGTKLLLELQSAEAAYKRALDGYPQIEFATTGTFNDVTLVSRAAAPVSAVKPNKKKYFLAGCILSLALAFGIPFAYELLLNRRLRCRDDFERQFGIHVLAEFEPIDQGRARG